MNEADAVKRFSPVTILDAEYRVGKEIPPFAYVNDEMYLSGSRRKRSDLDTVEQTETIDSVLIIGNAFLREHASGHESHLAQNDKMLRELITTNEDRIN